MTDKPRDTLLPREQRHHLLQTQGEYGTNLVCPRCGGGIPNSKTPGAYPGALSRLDNETEICSDCGYREAMYQMFGSKQGGLPSARGGGPLPPLDMPIDGYEPPTADPAAQAWLDEQTKGE